MGDAGFDPLLVGAQVRRRRRAAGLSQAQLAERSGVSRQAVGALESGRHLPRVDAALAIAAALGTTVEDLLVLEPPPALHVLGGQVDEGQAVLAAQVQPHTVCVPVPSGIGGEAWPAPDAVIRNGRIELLEAADLGRFVIVGCDPALGIVADLVPQRGPGRLLAVPASSAAARLALQIGRAHAAVVHDVRLAGLEREERVHRLVLARWRTGLAVDPATPAGGAKALAAALVGVGVVVQRDAGATAQVAYERALARVDARAPQGPIAAGHVDAARRARQAGQVAVTIEPVAVAFGLRFQALETHTVEVWIDRGAVDHPGALALGEVLTSARFRSRLSVLPGYELGEVA
jgi:transcriptional regulator with XRE-family HTH domain